MYVYSVAQRFYCNMPHFIIKNIQKSMKINLFKKEDTYLLLITFCCFTNPIQIG